MRPDEPQQLDPMIEAPLPEPYTQQEFETSELMSSPVSSPTPSSAEDDDDDDSDSGSQIGRHEIIILFFPTIPFQNSLIMLLLFCKIVQILFLLV